MAIILTSQLMIVLDASVIITSLPKIHDAFGFSPTGLSWVQNAYTLAFGGLLLFGARVGDILGRRRVYLAGIALFTLASLLGGLAPNGAWLLTTRAVQGMAAAIAAPSTLALLMMSFREPRERLRAISLYAAASSGGASVGLVLGGLLTDLASWRWGLFINVPIGIALVLLAPRYLPETDRNPGRFDLVGALSSTLGMTALVYGFVRAGSDGWSDRATVASFAAAVTLLAGFVLSEARAEQPIMPLRLFASRERSGAYVARLFTVGGMFAYFFFQTQFLQEVLGFSALKAGFAFLPMTAVLFATSRLVPRFAGNVGNGRLLVTGLLIALAAMAWTCRLSADTQYFPRIALPMVLLGLGMGIAFIPLTSSGIAGVDQKDSGAASGLVNAFHQVGGSLGLAVLVTVFGTAARDAARHPAAGVPAALAARQNLAHAISAALTGSVAFLTVAVLIVLTTAPGVVRRRVRRTEAVALPSLD
ncbi:MFS transporter [Actinocrinis puniceicyclus]|uniref:MFS transporter n=1 Tax=Actinocrinis puniceicyclus TaxID=977794 RepID=A0A8J7WR99_9ACTN|nr:MFS transporter [Actinocrinis puniceicyclus]MBS2964110.1 MFS transporter [Actinocrinis puniceicyclus]